MVDNSPFGAGQRCEGNFPMDDVVTVSGRMFAARSPPERIASASATGQSGTQSGPTGQGNENMKPPPGGLYPLAGTREKKELNSGPDTRKILNRSGRVRGTGTQRT